MEVTVIFVFLSLYAGHTACNEIVKSNIVIVIADDIGYNDVSLHGSDQILTPNIDMLAYDGIIIENYYSETYGTAAASALLTGKYPMKMGTQGPSIRAAEDRGVPLSEKLLPSYLKEAGYISHYVGKWALGKSRRSYLPMNRGFESFYGFTSPVDYFTYYHLETYNGTDFSGLGLFHNDVPVQDQQGHLTNVLTDQAINIINQHNKSTPLYLHVAHAAAHIGGALVNLQAPGEDLAANSHIAHSLRRRFGGLVCSLDRSVGEILEALCHNGMLENTLFIFAVENGADTTGVSRNYGCNLPLRGTKGTPWEGASRTTAIAWHAELSPKIWKGLFHVSDWLPTLLTVAGCDVPEGLDGIDQWNSIARDETPQRNEIIAIDDVNKWGTFRKGDLKIIVGAVPNTCGYYGQELSQLIYKAPDYERALLASKTFKVLAECLKIGFDMSYALEKRKLCNLNNRSSKSNGTALEGNICVPTIEKGCLYNISADPEESQDLWDKYPEIVLPMSFNFRLRWAADTLPRAPPSFDLRADPSNKSFVWQPWLEDDDDWPNLISEKPEYPMKVSPDDVRYFARTNARVLKEKTSNYLETISSLFVDSMSSMFN